MKTREQVERAKCFLCNRLNQLAYNIGTIKACEAEPGLFELYEPEESDYIEIENYIEIEKNEIEHHIKFIYGNDDLMKKVCKVLTPYMEDMIFNKTMALMYEGIGNDEDYSKAFDRFTKNRDKMYNFILKSKTVLD